MLNNLISELHSLANADKAKILSWFFKTGIWQYGEWDIFLWITVPESRKIVNKYYKDLKFNDILILLNSEIHEERLIGASVLVEQFKKASIEDRKEIFDFYLLNSKRFNNWDLVDLSAPSIVWWYLAESWDNKDILYRLVQSENLWEKRISVLATFAFIKKNDFEDILKISKILLKDKHDLMHKAVGWMLREVGKREKAMLIAFLDENTSIMPRTALRYAIERFDEPLRKYYLSFKFQK
ncbi:MAG: hypothetical protein ACD_2C00079G0019 [uncultured bacterium (gcode 4)]|uniref:DNA alkylation repair protein n=1 Tax=uncultured bacterium (gcode 4) TaxID=1234023 RepID=K2G6E6_9BACT|nr:MAG: hypothetical protein ACD_2C00079G0019 [uncultured bacterium (gcode 4)]